MTMLKIQQTSIGAVATSATVPTGETYQVHNVLVGIDVAPTTSANMTITVDDDSGSAYDTQVHTVDLQSATALEWYPGGTLILQGGDALDVAYTNPDARTVGVTITVEVV